MESVAAKSCSEAAAVSSASAGVTVSSLAGPTSTQTTMFFSNKFASPTTPVPRGSNGSPSRRPCLQFPPPPPYPPPPATCTSEYSYAYHEHTNSNPTTSTTTPVPGNHLHSAGNAGSRRHAYTNRFGTEENIYEEITDVNIQEEVKRVQSGHRRVLGELNLAVEAMLAAGAEAPAPSSPTYSTSGTSAPSGAANGSPDMLEDLLATVSPTDDLLSPPPAVNAPTIPAMWGSPLLGRAAAAAVAAAPRQAKRWRILPGNNNKDESTGSPCAWQGVHDPPLNNQVLLLPSQTAPSSPRAAHHVFNRLHNGSNSRRQISLDDTWLSTNHHQQTGNGAGDDSSSAGDDELLVTKQNTSSAPGRNGRVGLRSGLARALQGWREEKPQPAPPPPPPPPPPHLQKKPSRLFGRSKTAANLAARSSEVVPEESHLSNRHPVGPSSVVPALASSTMIMTSAATRTGSPRRTPLPLQLPPAPAGLTYAQQQRRAVFQLFLNTEANYIESLERLVTFKRMAEETAPGSLNSTKVNAMFHRVPEILQCHALFRVALAEAAHTWDRTESLGDAVTASFNKPVIIQVYVEYVTNFSQMYAAVHKELRRNSQFAALFQQLQANYEDKSQLNALLIKPVQRIPQLILILKDMIKYTPADHADLCKLKRALSQIELIAQTLNSRKAEAEQQLAYRAFAKQLRARFNARGSLAPDDARRYLIRDGPIHDTDLAAVVSAEAAAAASSGGNIGNMGSGSGGGSFDASSNSNSNNSAVSQPPAKPRKLLLMNDLLVCVSTRKSQQNSSAAPPTYHLKWKAELNNLQVSDCDNGTKSSLDPLRVQNACNVISNCIDVLDQFKDHSEVPIGSCQAQLKELTNRLQALRSDHQASLDLIFKKERRRVTFASRADKLDWLEAIRHAQLAASPNNAPGWQHTAPGVSTGLSSLEHGSDSSSAATTSLVPITKPPLFVTESRLRYTRNYTEVRCGCSYPASLQKTNTRDGHSSSRPQYQQHYIWLGSVCDQGEHSLVTILSQSHARPEDVREQYGFVLEHTIITAMECIRLSNGTFTIWIGTDNNRVDVYTIFDEEQRPIRLSSMSVKSPVFAIRQLAEWVYIALGNGHLTIHRADSACEPTMSEIESSSSSSCSTSSRRIVLGSEPVAALAVHYESGFLYAACGRTVYLVRDGHIESELRPDDEGILSRMSGPAIAHLALAGHSMLWLAYQDSSVVSVVDTETRQTLHHINIAASNLVGLVAAKHHSQCGGIGGSSGVMVTALATAKGFLWLGTDAGLILTLPLPRLNGAPLAALTLGAPGGHRGGSGGPGVSISVHAHCAPIRWLHILNDTLPPYLTPSNSHSTNPFSNAASNSPQIQNSSQGSPSSGRGLTTSDSQRSRTPALSVSSQDSCDVYGLYGELMCAGGGVAAAAKRLSLGSEGAYEELSSLLEADGCLTSSGGPNQSGMGNSNINPNVNADVTGSEAWSVDSLSSHYTSSGSERPVEDDESTSHSTSINSSRLPIDKSTQTDDPNSNNTLANVNNQQSSKSSRQRHVCVTLAASRGYKNWRGPANMDIGDSSCAHLVVWETIN